MKFGLFAANYGTCADTEAAIAVAKHAEAAGFESLWTGEHVVLPDPQPEAFALAPTLPLLDTVVALTLIAAHTTTVKVASGIIVLPLRNPVILAKELASVDVVSHGRLIVGVGAGYVAEEFSATGVPMSDRGARMDDYLRAMRALWSMPRPRHDGPYVSFAGIDAHPRPRQQPGPPIVVGGGSPGALRRAVTMADGWGMRAVTKQWAETGTLLSHALCTFGIGPSQDHNERKTETKWLTIRSCVPTGQVPVMVISSASVRVLIPP